MILRTRKGSVAFWKLYFDVQRTDTIFFVYVEGRYRGSTPSRKNKSTKDDVQSVVEALKDVIYKRCPYLMVASFDPEPDEEGNMDLRNVAGV